MTGHNVLQVPATEMKARLAEFLRVAEGGQRIAVSRNGKVVAFLVPAGDIEQEACRSGVARFRRAIAQLPPMRMTVEEILAARDEGRRF